MFQIRNLTREAAELAARHATAISRRGHVFYQLRNGRWRWGRQNWAHKLLVCRVLPKVYYVSTNGQVVTVKEH